MGVNRIHNSGMVLEEVSMKMNAFVEKLSKHLNG